LLVSGPAGLAGRVSGTIVLAVPGVSLIGILGLVVNTGPDAVETTFRIGDGEAVELSAPAGAYLAVTGTGVRLAIAGQELLTDVTITRDAAGIVTLALRNSALTLGGSSTAPLVRVAQLPGTTATVVLSAAGLVLEGIVVTVSLAVPGLAIGGEVHLWLDSRPAATGRGLLVEGTGLVIEVLGQRLAGDLVLEQATLSDGTSVVRLAVSHGSLDLGGGVVEATDVEGRLELGSAGLTGRLDAALSVGSGPFSVSGGVSLAVNTTGTAALGLPAGPYLRVEGSGVVLTVAGQQFSGNLVLEQRTGTAGTALVRLALTGVEVTLAGGLARLSHGSALFVLAGGTIAGQVGGTVTLAVPGLSLSGTLGLQLNTGHSAVAESFTLAGTTTALSIAADVPLRLSGTGLTLQVAGAVDLRADVVATWTSGGFTLDLSNGSLALGAGPLVQATGIAGQLTATAQGSHGSLTVATLGVATGGLSIVGTVTAVFNSGASTVDGIAPGFALAVADASLTTDSFSFGAATLAVAADRTTGEVSVHATGITFALGDVVTVRAANAWAGTLLITGAGVAASFSGSLDGVFAIPGVTFAGTAALQLNTTAAAISRPGLGLALPAGPYVEVALDNAVLAVAGGPSLRGSFLVSHSGTTTVIAFTGVSLTLSGGSNDGLAVTDGVGAFAVIAAAGTAAGGVAGAFSGTVKLAAGSFSAGAEVSVRFNTSAQAVHTQVVVGGTTLAIDFADTEVATTSPAAPFLQVTVSGAL
ncbi:MAG TPA: hypothetical protein PLE12_12010, partial [Propionicimonas sp.]|nr:hypothetical protein [Propionicimonas sp.]